MVDIQTWFSLLRGFCVLSVLLGNLSPAWCNSEIRETIQTIDDQPSSFTLVELDQFIQTETQASFPSYAAMTKDDPYGAYMMALRFGSGISPQRMDFELLRIFDQATAVVLLAADRGDLFDSDLWRKHEDLPVAIGGQKDYARRTHFYSVNNLYFSETMAAEALRILEAGPLQSSALRTAFVAQNPAQVKSDERQQSRLAWQTGLSLLLHHFSGNSFEVFWPEPHFAKTETGRAFEVFSHDTRGQLRELYHYYRAVAGNSDPERAFYALSPVARQAILVHVFVQLQVLGAKDLASALQEASDLDKYTQAGLLHEDLAHLLERTRGWDQQELWQAAYNIIHEDELRLLWTYPFHVLAGAYAQFKKLQKATSTPEALAALGDETRKLVVVFPFVMKRLKHMDLEAERKERIHPLLLNLSFAKTYSFYQNGYKAPQLNLYFLKLIRQYYGSLNDIEQAAFNWIERFNRAYAVPRLSPFLDIGSLLEPAPSDEPGSDVRCQDQFVPGPAEDEEI